MKKKVLKSILLIILIAILIIIAFFGRKVMILSKLDKSVSNLEDTKDNIYVKVIYTGNPPVESETELFIKGNVEKSVLSRNSNGNLMKMIQIIYPNERKVYTESGEDKFLIVYNETASKRTTDINASSNTHTVLVNYAHSTDFANRILTALHTSIKTTEINGKECYELSGMNSPIFLYYENAIGMSVYLEKETGLPIKLVETIEENGEIKEYITEYEIKFDCVTEEDISEPDASQ